LNIIYILIVDYETTIRCIAMPRVYRTCLFITRIVVQSYAFIPHNARALSRVSRVTRFEIRRMHFARIAAYSHSGVSRAEFILRNYVSQKTYAEMFVISAM